MNMDQPLSPEPPAHAPGPGAPHPVQYSVDYPDRPLNRLTTFFRLVVAVPILIVIGLVEGSGYGYSGGRTWAVGAAGLVVLPTLLLILFRQRYPRWWFDWNLELMRFSARVEGPTAHRVQVAPSGAALAGRAHRPGGIGLSTLARRRRYASTGDDDSVADHARCYPRWVAPVLKHAAARERHREARGADARHGNDAAPVAGDRHGAERRHPD